MTEDRTLIKVKTEATVDENILKYKFSRILNEQELKEYKSIEDALINSPLASRVFKIKGIEKVSIGLNFLMITKFADVSWDKINSELAGQLEEFFASGEQAILQIEINIEDIKNMSDEDRAIFEKIEQILEEEVRPILLSDGGNIELVGFKENIVYVKLLGACHGCPGAAMTLKHSVEKTLKKHFQDSVQQVIKV